MNAKDTGEDEMMYVQVDPVDIDLFNKLLEGYDNLALVSADDAGIGRLVLLFARCAKKDLLAVLRCLPIPVAIEQD